MSSTTRRGMNVIRESEQQLRELLRQAGSAGDYESVITLTSWARSLASLAASPGGDDQGVAGTTQVESTHSLSRGGSRGMRAVAQRKRPAKGDYPRFLRRGDDLVKVGWSRRARAEYEHKVPNGVVPLVAQAIAKAGAPGEVTATEKFLTAVTSGDGSTVPEYQVYVVLAWLRSLGLVAQHGRQGYVVPQANDLASRLKAAWERLPKA